MSHNSSDLELRVSFARELSRRRLFAGVGVAAASLALPYQPAFAAQTATPPAADQAQLDQLIALSQSLCGGGSFDPAQASLLLQLVSSDSALTHGLTKLYTASPATPGPDATPTGGATPAAASRSKDAQAAAEAILNFWYAGVFNGEPIQNRSGVYTNLVAWQAMYTPAWTTCKLFGGWADAPTLTPQVPENA